MSKITVQTIYEQHKNDVYTYLLSLTQNKPLSEDLTSDVFLSAIISIHAFKGNSSIKTWLFAIARHKWYEHLRKSKNVIEPEDLMKIYLSNVTSLETDMITKELIDRIYELLEKEPGKNKDIVLMRVKGYAYFEIARKHNISESSARVIDFRTKGRIRANLLEEGYNGGSDCL